MARVVVCGYMLRHPIAGNLLAFFHYVLGLERLGHDVVYLEESGWANSCYNPDTRRLEDFPDSGLRIVRALMDAYHVHAGMNYVDRETGRSFGANAEERRDVLREADVLLNVGGVCWLPEFLLCRRRAIIDMDPLFTQVGRFGSKLLADHHVHFSYGANIGTAQCSIPTCGVEWLPAFPPVVTEIWEGAEPPPEAPYTTIASLNPYGDVKHEGETYGQKDVELARVIDLPGAAPRRLELALSGGHEVRERLRSSGWIVRDAGDEVGTDVSAYMAYIRSSRGEFSVAKNAYVRTRSGWFSDRSVCYLAAGLPVVLQDTGFSDWLPTGRGVLAFRTCEEAAARLAEVEADYPDHRRAAREIAREFFDHRVVLSKLLDSALDAAPSLPGVSGGRS